MNIAQRFQGCILAGAIGDAYGSSYENISTNHDEAIFYPFGAPPPKVANWQITDDTQLTLATIQAMITDSTSHPKTIADHFLQFFQLRKLRGVGASTLKALRELNMGGHWGLIGRKGEFAAGNGAAMRVAPLAFRKNISDRTLRDICYITHQNEEAYIGAKCVVLAIRAILEESWKGDSNLIEMLIEQIPDTRVRDRLILIKDLKDLSAIGKMGNDGYVVNSIPLAIAAANQIKDIGLERMYSTLIEVGGDTDTNCSIAGQIAGTLIGVDNIPTILLQKLSRLDEFDWIQNTMNDFVKNENWE